MDDLVICCRNLIVIISLSYPLKLKRRDSIEEHCLFFNSRTKKSVVYRAARTGHKYLQSRGMRQIQGGTLILTYCAML